MKLEIRGSDHEYKYVVEQSLLALFPQERPVYEPVDRENDQRWAVITLREEGDQCQVTEFHAGPVERERVRRQADQTALDLLRRHLTGLD